MLEQLASKAPYDMRAGITEAANALGIDPIDLATAISYETAGTFDARKAGPTTQWGQHRGLIQFGEPQAQKYGVDWDSPEASQLGADGAVVRYLKDTGVRPGMGLLDVYSAINAGGVGRYNRSDANNGGAPGTVRDKVNSQMAGHRAKALKLFGGELPQGRPVSGLSQAMQSGSTPISGESRGAQPSPLEMLASMKVENPQANGVIPRQSFGVRRGEDGLDKFFRN